MIVFLNSLLFALLIAGMIIAPVMWLMIRIEKKYRKEREARTWCFISYCANGLYFNSWQNVPKPKTKTELEDLLRKLTEESETRHTIKILNIIEVEDHPKTK